MQEESDTVLKPWESVSKAFQLWQKTSEMWSPANPWDTSSSAEPVQKNEKYPSWQAAAQQSVILQYALYLPNPDHNQYFPEATRGDIYQGKGYCTP